MKARILFVAVVVAGISLAAAEAQTAQDRARIDYEVARIALANGQYEQALGKFEAVAEVLGRQPGLLALIAEAALGADMVEKAEAAGQEALAGADDTFRSSAVYTRLIETIAQIELRKSGVRPQAVVDAAIREIQTLGLPYSRDGLFDAIKNRNLPAVKAFVRAGFDLNFQQNVEGHLSGLWELEGFREDLRVSYSPLIFALRQGTGEIARTLLIAGGPEALTWGREEGVRVETEWEGGREYVDRFPLFGGVSPVNALLLGYRENAENQALFALMREKGAAVGEDALRCVLTAARFDNPISVELMASLLDAGADVNSVSSGARDLPSECEVEPPLIQVIGNYVWPEGVRFLLSRGADPNLARFKGAWTPLDTAAARCAPELVTILLEAGANPHVSSQQKNKKKTVVDMIKPADMPKKACQETAALLRDALKKRRP